MLYTLWLNQVGIKDLNLVGGKNGSLGEMLQNLTNLGIKVPNGFVITTVGYDKYLEYNNLREKMDTILNEMNYQDNVSVKRAGMKVRSLIQNGSIPEDMKTEILECYVSLSHSYLDVEGNPQEFTDVAVRSSGTAEDLPNASFAGQQETYLNVRGVNKLYESIKNCFASLYTDRAISYRKKLDYDNTKVKISVGVQKMVRSDLGSAGVAFTLDPDSGFRDIVLVNGSWGLGEMVVRGSVTPDEFILYKKNLGTKKLPILDKKLGDKTRKLVYGTNPNQLIKEIGVEDSKQKDFCISDKNLVKLGEWCMDIEKYYCNLYNRWCPVDIEWAIDGITDQIYIVQARPETVFSNKYNNTISEYRILSKDKQDSHTLVQGVAVGNKAAVGKVKIIYSLDSRDGSLGEENFEEGDILVTDITTPDWENLMQKASAIITNKGGRVCHAAIIAREFGIPTVVGTGNCTDVLKNNQLVTVSCCEGDVGFVYQGKVNFIKEDINLESIPKVKTSVMMNIANPSHAFKNAILPHRGVGLLRSEFIINNFIQIHPNALLAYDKHNKFQNVNNEINDSELWNKIEKLIYGYKSGKDYYITKLAYGISRIAVAFHPHPVIVRFSDFKSNEYCNLPGGKYFEPDEENPMIGWRGCSRYYSNNFRKAFGMECQAILKVREEMGLTNVVVMLPFCRTVEECIQVQKTMKYYGLERGVNGLEVYLMCEIPSNVVMATEFAEHIDGFSIGSNDLTQLTLGLDRDSGLVSHLFNERNTAVKRMISMAINLAKSSNTKIGICGQAPSDYPDFAEFLVREGIDSISLMPDTVLKTIKNIKRIEDSQI